MNREEMLVAFRRLHEKDAALFDSLIKDYAKHGAKMFPKKRTEASVVWNVTVLAIVWAHVEFLIWRDGCTKVSAYNRLAQHGMQFGIPQGDGPTPSTKTYYAEKGKGGTRDGQNIEAIYKAARTRRKNDETIRNMSDFYLEALRDDHTGGFLTGFLNSRRIPPPIKQPT